MQIYTITNHGNKEDEALTAILRDKVKVASKRVNRNLDIATGINTVSYRRVFKNKKAYDRKQFKHIQY